MSLIDLPKCTSSQCSPMNEYVLFKYLLVRRARCVGAQVPRRTATCPSLSDRWKAVPARVQELLCSGPGERWYRTGVQHQADWLSIVQYKVQCSSACSRGNRRVGFVRRSARFSDKKKDLPGDIDSAIKALFELYDPAKKGFLSQCYCYYSYYDHCY